MPVEPNQLAKMIGDMATGQAAPEPDTGKNPKAIARGRKGGAKGGPARAANLTPIQRKGYNEG